MVVMSKIILKNMVDRYEKKKINKILYLDLETKMSPRFSAEGSFIFCYVARMRNVKSQKSEEFYNWTFPESLKNMNVKKPIPYKNDLRLLEEISFLLKNSDMVVGHFARFFDFPFFRTRCDVLNRKDLIPTYQTIRYADTWLMYKKSRKYMSNKLEHLSKVLGKDLKTKINPLVWESLMWKNTKAMAICLNHCRKDVQMLEMIHRKIEDSVPIPSTYV